MREKTISILGCGYLGLPVAAALLDRGWRVRGSTTTVSRLDTLLAAGVEPFLLRLSPQVEGRAVEDFFLSETLLLNFPPGRRRPDVESFMDGAIRHILRYTANVCRIIFASSTSVYGSGEVDETTPPAPRTASGRSLVRAEEQLRARCGLSVTVLRFGGLYGYTRQPGRFLARVANGVARVNLVHRDDAVNVVVRVAEDRSADALYNVVAPLHPRKDVFYRHAAARLGREAPRIAYDPTDPGKRVRSTWLCERLGYQFLYADPMAPAP